LAIQTGEVAARMGQFCPDIKLRFAVRGEEGMYFPLTKFIFLYNKTSINVFLCGNF